MNSTDTHIAHTSSHTECLVNQDHAVHRWVDVRAHDPVTSSALLALFSALFVKVAAERFGKFTGEIADDADVYRNRRDVVFFWRTDMSKKLVRR